MSIKKHPLYRRFSSMRTRCTNKKNKDYKRYGAKGIRIEWRSFDEFCRDMYPSFCKHVAKYGLKNTQIDRIDFTGNYSKKNCRWATSKEQGWNRYTNRMFTLNGRTMPIAGWAASIGMSRQALRYRLNQGLTIGEAISMPINHGNKYAII